MGNLTRNVDKITATERWHRRRIKNIIKLKVERNIIFLDKKVENNMENHNWKCGICNFIWRTNMNNIINHGSGCKKCSSGKSEEMIRRIFESMFYRKKFETTRALNCLRYKNNRNLELDGYNEKLKIAFEYQGIQHYELSSFHHNPSKKLIEERKMTDDDIEKYRNDKFVEQQKRDIFKKEKCKDADIILVIVSHKDRELLHDESYRNIIKSLILTENPNFDKINFSDIEPNFTDISSVNKLTQYFISALQKEDYDLKDPKVVITHYRQMATVICAGKNFTKTRHEYETYIDNFINRGRRCKYCHSPQPEDFEKVFNNIKDVMLTTGPSKRDKYFRYTCTCCNKTYVDTISNMKKGLDIKPTRNICKLNKCTP